MTETKLSCELLHHDEDEAPEYAPVKADIEITPHGGIVISCLDAKGGKSEVWLENYKGILAVRVYIPDCIEKVSPSETISHTVDAPFIDARLSLPNSAIIVGDTDTSGGYTVGVQVSGGDADTPVALSDRIRKMTCGEWNELQDEEILSTPEPVET